MTRRDALPRVLRRPRGARRASPRRTRSRSTRSPCAASPRTRCCPFAQFAREHPYEVRFIEFMPLDADHAWTPDSVLSGEEIRARSSSAWPLEPDAARAARHRARLPLRRRRGPHRVHQPGVRAVLRRLQPHPPDRRRPAAHVPVLAQRDRPARARCARAPTTTSSSRSSATRCGARSSSTTSTSPGFVQPARTMSAIGG